MAVKSKSAVAAHTAGIFADMTLDGPEIGTLVAVVDRAKNLPNRKTMGKQDPYCAMRLGKEAKKTETDRRGGQTPKWDQELRFTVHDSPDYYKLKISVFNDDKRTDLIGEAFVDLRDLIKPGGGSNDLWHQLNYKGKYAGDIRMEMTYYDIRPREENMGEKRRTRDKAVSVTSGTTSTVSGPRQLGGPREVRRRPLPASPNGNIHPPSTPQDQPPQLPPKLPLTTPAVETNPTLESFTETELYGNHYSTTPIPCEPEYQHVPSQEYDESEQYQPENDFLMYAEPELHRYDVSGEQFRTSTSSLPNPLMQQRSHISEIDEWEGLNRRHSDYVLPVDNHITQNRPPPALIHHPNSAPEVLQYKLQNHNASPTKMVQFRDSPLRHSVDRQDDTYSHVDPFEQDDAPPPPPKHRESLPRKPQPEYPPSAYTPKPVRPTSRHSSVDDRSPLQSIEHQYSPYNTTPLPTPPRKNSYECEPHTSYDRLHNSSRRNSGEVCSTLSMAVSGPERQGSYNSSYGHESVISHRAQPVSDNFHHHGRLGSGNAFPPQRTDQISHAANEYFNPQPEYRLEGNPDSSTSTYNASLNNGSQAQMTEVSSTPPLRVRPQKNCLVQTPTRKAISTSPYPEPNHSRLHGMPFGPDSYDVLNPASSPATNENTPFETPEQSKESARLREVERLREQGPIIGNDGRVIDPSDHLPSDTWAPEPERKQRKPEHVIHIRARNDVRAQTTPNSSPASIRMNMHKGPVMGSPSPSSPITTPPTSSYNRFQKLNSNRPLPVQPFQQQRPLSSHNDLPNQQGHRRNSYHNISPGVERPPLSEYQVSVNGNNGPYNQERSPGSNFQQPNPRMAYVEDYPANCYDDPLSAEMRMIDIGPSRAGRTMARSSRGY